MNSKIKHVILDIDGVVLGSKPEINFPFPTKEVIQKINEINKSGIKISFCTGKPTFALKLLLKHFSLDSYHITDGGAVVFNPNINDFLVKKTLNRKIAADILKAELMTTESWQVYTLQSKYIEKKKFNPRTIEDTRIMPYQAVDNLVQIAKDNDVTKFELLYAPKHENTIKKMLNNFDKYINVQWTHVPALLPNKILIITAKDIEKKSSVQVMLKHIRCLPENVLAVGDTLMDWNFMQDAGFIATMGNASDQMKQFVKHGGFIAGHVNDNGLLDLFDYFKL